MRMRGRQQQLLASQLLLQPQRCHPLERPQARAAAPRQPRPRPPRYQPRPKQVLHGLVRMLCFTCCGRLAQGKVSWHCPDVEEMHAGTGGAAAASGGALTPVVAGPATPASGPAVGSALKRQTPGSGALAALLPSGPAFRVSGLRKQGGIKLHNLSRQ
jgi:hypothetical protein